MKRISAISLYQYLLFQRQAGWPRLIDVTGEAARPHRQGRLYQSRHIHFRT